MTQDPRGMGASARSSWGGGLAEKSGRKVKDNSGVGKKSGEKRWGKKKWIMTEMDTDQLTEVEVLRITGKLRKPPIGRKNPKKDKQRLKIFRQVCFMSELQLQSLLDRTQPIIEALKPTQV